jgi:DmsE family decaheme c-type cytochrome
MIIIKFTAMPRILILPFLLLLTLMLYSGLQIAAETEATEAAPAVAAPAEEEKAPVEVKPTDAVEAGEAEHAFKQENPCEGQAQGEIMGADVCADCHLDKVKTMQVSPHGIAADARSPFGRDGCETCHGPGMLHFETEGNCIISMTGRYGESVEQRNGICLQCHQGGNRIHWAASIHQAEGLACVSCHSIHSRNDVIHRTTQNEVCFKCHKDIRSQTFRASSHPLRESKLVCSDCHNPHGSAGTTSLKQFTINENCYSCHAEKRGPFLWEHQPASEDCTLCHRVHGSNHMALLNKPGPKLCQQCHIAQSGIRGGNHISNFLDYDSGSAGRNRFLVAQNCANCHSKVHGSNHPSGAALQR